MTTSAAKATLEAVPVALIDPNPENPRLYFRPKEMEELLESIHRYGVQVPISVYREGKRYVLLDGERRWRCASKLNMKTIPALVQERPTRVNNILLMFNIHALREQWDLLTIALKLQDVLPLLDKENGGPLTEAELAGKTGLSRGVVRRCRYLLDLPDRYRKIILAELKRPKQKQKLTEDFFIELERALKTVERSMPDVLQDKDAARKVLIKKFEDGVVQNRVHFRKLAQIARAKSVAADVGVAKAALRKALTPNNYSIERAYKDSVSGAYEERDIVARLNGLIDHLESLDADDVDEQVKAKLRQLIALARRLVGDA